MPKTFDPATDIPDLSGKVILVTGGNSGLGRESILQLASHNPRAIYLAARTRSTAESTASSIRETHPTANIILLDLDLGSLASVKAAAATFTAASDRLDILLLNAGIAAAPPGLTEDGYEMQFGTNHMGHALFTQLLMPTLLRTAAAAAGETSASGADTKNDEGPPTPPKKQSQADVRIVTLSSDAHTFSPKGGIQFPLLKTPMSSNASMVRYGHSKLASLLFAKELAKRYPTLTSVSCHPGTVDTGLIRSSEKSHPYLAKLAKPVMRVFAQTVQTGAKTQLWCCTAKEGVRSGAFYQPIGKEGGENAMGRDEGMARELWEWTDKELKEHGAPGWPGVEDVGEAGEGKGETQ